MPGCPPAQPAAELGGRSVRRGPCRSRGVRRDPGEAFAALAEPLLAEPAVQPGTNVTKRPGLRVGGKIFAMLVSDTLVVKLRGSSAEALAFVRRA